MQSNTLQDWKDFLDANGINYKHKSWEGKLAPGMNSRSPDIQYLHIEEDEAREARIVVGKCLVHFDEQGFFEYIEFFGEE